MIIRWIGNGKKEEFSFEEIKGEGEKRGEKEVRKGGKNGGVMER